MHFARKTAGIALVVGTSLASSLSFAAWNITPIVYSGASATWVLGINNKGEALGAATVDGQTRGFVYKSGTFFDFAGPTGSTGSWLTDASDVGQYVGSYTHVLPSGVLVTSSFLFDQTGFSTISVPGALHVDVGGISPNGRYVSGMWGSRDWTNSNYDRNATTNGQGFILDRVDNSITFVGAASRDSHTVLQGINDAGVVAGLEWSYPSPIKSVAARPFSYDLHSGETSFYPASDAFSPAAGDVDAKGRLLGFAPEVSFPSVPDLYGLVYQTFGWEGLTAKPSFWLRGTNDAGAVAGNVSFRDNRSVGFLALPVPEPETYAMFIGGLALIGVVRRRS